MPSFLHTKHCAAVIGPFMICLNKLHWNRNDVWDDVIGTPAIFDGSSWWYSFSGIRFRQKHLNIKQIHYVVLTKCAFVCLGRLPYEYSVILLSFSCLKSAINRTEPFEWEKINCFALFSLGMFTHKTLNVNRHRTVNMNKCQMYVWFAGNFLPVFKIIWIRIYGILEWMKTQNSNFWKYLLN